MTCYNWTAILGEAGIDAHTTEGLLALTDKSPMMYHMFEAIKHGYPVVQIVSQTLECVAAEQVRLMVMAERLLAYQPPGSIVVNRPNEYRAGLAVAAQYARDHGASALADEIEKLP